MAEDQSVNGDRWNDQATKLLEKLNWEPLGDSNIDVPNIKNTTHGLDRLFRYLDPNMSDIYQGVIVEAKRYKISSFKPSALEDWINTVDAKLTNIKNSEGFYGKFPMMEDSPLRTGLIVIWFKEFLEYASYKEKFWRAATSIKLTKKNERPNKIYILENDAILRLASLVICIEKINSQPNLKRVLQFYYPSTGAGPIRRSQVLDLNFMVSKFILADFQDENSVENKVVFYFGKLNYESFLRLKGALSSFSHLDIDKPLTIYIHVRDDDEFRKIQPEVIKLFKENTISLKGMESIFDLPTFMRD